MKHLPKHLRPKWRYIAVGIETWPDVRVSRGGFQRTLWESAQTLLGDVGRARLDLSVLGFTFEDGYGETIVRTRREWVPETRAVIGCIADVTGSPIGVQVRGISGTVKSCEEKYLGRQPEVLPERRVVFEDASRMAWVRGHVVDVSLEDAFAGATILDLE